MRERGVWLWLPVQLLAAGSAQASSLDGWLAVGARGDTRPRAEGHLEARVEYETGRYHGVEGVLEVGVDSHSRQVEIKDAYIDAKGVPGELGLRLGRGKKVLGWEYEDPRRERLTLERSIVYRFMESAALVGRDILFSVRHDAYRATVHYGEIGDAALALGMDSELVTGAIWGTWLLLQRDHYGAFTWAGASGVKVTVGRHRGVAEVLAGVDPYQSELEAVFGSGGKVYFAAAKVEYGIAVGAWMPYLQGAVLFPDLGALPRDNLQGLIGVRYTVFDGLLLASELEVTGNDRVSLSTGRIWSTPRYRVEVRFFFS